MEQGVGISLSKDRFAEIATLISGRVLITDKQGKIATGISAELIADVLGTKLIQDNRSCHRFVNQKLTEYASDISRDVTKAEIEGFCDLLYEEAMGIVIMDNGSQILVGAAA